MANSHPGSYCGQDAYNDMLVTEDELFVSGNRNLQGIGCCKNLGAKGLQGCNGLNFEGGYNPMEQEMIGTVRRLMPEECELLQGYPIGYTNIGEWIDSKGKKHETVDSARYKALGNSIALPFWFVLLRRISAVYDRPATLGSLFDGIGGFPLVFSRAGCEPIWASEIEEFPIAVTKIRFKEEL